VESGKEEHSLIEPQAAWDGLMLQSQAMDNLTAHNASDYDQKVRQTIPFYDTIHTEVIRLVKIIKPEAKSWVDTGCGTGRLVQQALASFPATQFILADPSEAMLGQARTHFSNEESARLKILLPIGSAGLVSQIGKSSADVLTAIQCHHYLQRAERMDALRACYEVLRPGGLLVTFENVAPRTPEGVRLGLAGWKSFLIAQGRTEEEAEQHLARYGREFLPITAEEHLAALTQAGFDMVELFWYSQMQAGFYALR
jgi:tRNA (cmo5U34)-methyltransferase